MGEYVVGPDHPESADVQALLEVHLVVMLHHSPPEDVHALDVTGLLAENVSLYSIRVNGALLGIGALKQLDAVHAELKSMHTAEAARGRGVGRAMLSLLARHAARRGFTRLTGDVLADNVPMIAMLQRIGAELAFRDDEPGLVLATLSL